jgi:hypothetical protein
MAIIVLSSIFGHRRLSTVSSSCSHLISSTDRDQGPAREINSKRAHFLMGHSMSNQHAKWTPVTDFAETW